MDERILFDRFHQALDIESPPGAYERLRIALVKSSVKPLRRPPLQLRWSQMGLRLAAALTAIVLAVVAIAAFLATHAPTGSIPAGSDRAIHSYQTLIDNDYHRPVDLPPNSGSCASILGAECAVAASRLADALQLWLDDLNRSEPPARFAFVDAQLRRHLALAISDFNAVAAAQRSQDQRGMAEAMQAALNEKGWIDDAVSGILKSQQGTIATYKQAVRFHKQNLDQCAACEPMVSQNGVICNRDQASACQYENEIQHTSFLVVRFEAAIIEVAAPNSLMTKDRRLQSDLAKADTALMTMTAALSVGDQAGYDTGRISLQRALAVVDQDAADILNG